MTPFAFGSARGDLVHNIHIYISLLFGSHYGMTGLSPNTYSHESQEEHVHLQSRQQQRVGSAQLSLFPTSCSEAQTLKYLEY